MICALSHPTVALLLQNIFWWHCTPLSYMSLVLLTVFFNAYVTLCCFVVENGLCDEYERR